MTRREMAGLGLAAVMGKGRGVEGEIVYTGRGFSGFMNPDRRLEVIGRRGGKGRVLALGEAGQSSWGHYGTMRDGRLLLMSLELPADWKGKTFDDYHPRSRTRIWAYERGTGRLEELCFRERLSSFYAPCGEVGERLAVTAMVGGKSVLYLMERDGSKARAVTGEREFVYGVSVAPDGGRVAFHADYKIHACRVDGSERKMLGAVAGELHFGTSWSADGEWVLFQGCESKLDPAHDWSRIGRVRASGGEAEWLTGRAGAWFGASYGARGNPGGGSNQPVWMGERVLYVRRMAGSVTPWEYQAGRKDTDHFNRELRPEKARGGTHLAVVDPGTGREEFLTPAVEGVWDFRAAWSEVEQAVVFCRAEVGKGPELWVVEMGGKARRLTRGLRGAGVEHPAWLRRM